MIYISAVIIIEVNMEGITMRPTEWAHTVSGGFLCDKCGGGRHWVNPVGMKDFGRPVVWRWLWMVFAQTYT